MKAGQRIIIVCCAVGAFFVGRMIPTRSDTEGEVDQPRIEKRSPLRSQLGTSGRQFKDYSWTEVMTLAESAQDNEDWIAILHESRHDPFLMRAIVRRWAERDAPACWKHLLTLGDDLLPPQHLAEIVAQAWGKQDSEGALATLAAMDLNEKSHVYQRSDLSWVIVRAALAEDFERGMALLPLPFPGGTFGSGSLEPWIVADPEKGCPALADLPHDCIFRRTVGRVALEWYNRDPVAALAWCQQASPDLQREAYKEIAKQLVAAEDYEGARDLALTVDSMSLRQSVSMPYVSHLTRTDPVVGCIWVLENFDGQMVGGALGNIVGNADFKAHPPEEFLPFFDQIPEGNGKVNSARRFVRRWMSTDGLAAVTWGESLDPRTRSEVMSGFTVGDWASHGQSREWLKTTADTNFSRQTLEAIVARIKNPDEARKWAASLPAERAAQVEAALVKVAEP